MSETEAFFDTNVLLYVLSADEPKANRAEALVEAGGVISVQVLNEFASDASRKLGMAWGDIREVLDTFCALCRVEPLDLKTHARGLSFAERYRYSVYDAMILASARRANCTILYSEDLQQGQLIDDRIKIVNPFADLRV